MTKNHILAMNQYQLKKFAYWMKQGAFLSMALAVEMAIAINPAFADLQGGIDKTKSYAEQVKQGFIAVGGIIAVIYLMWKGLECWRGRADWGEFGMSVFYVALVGGAAALANWAWTAFTS